MIPSNNLENKTPLDTYRRVQLSMYASSGSQFSRTTTGMQSGQDAFDKSRFVMTFLIILGTIRILCSFRLAVERKMGKEIPESSRS